MHVYVLCCVFVAVVMLGMESQWKAWHIDHDIIAWKCATWAWYKRWKECVRFQGVGDWELKLIAGSVI